MRNKFTKFLTSECPPKGMRQFAKTWKYAACMLLALVLGVGNVWAQTIYDMESGSAWGGSNTSNRALNAAAKRTGSQGLYATGSNGNGRRVNSPANAVEAKTKYYAICWVCTSENATAGIGIGGAASSYPFECVKDTWRSIYVEYTQGNSASNKTICPTFTFTKSTTLYVDDVVFYATTADGPDLSYPNSPTAGASTTTAINWTNRDDSGDGATGRQATLIWKRTTGSANDLTLNNQGNYVVPAEGSTLDQSGHWTLVTASIDADAVKYEGTFVAGEVYAIVHRDLAYNYSAPAYVTITAATNYTITYDANGGSGTMENTTNTVAVCGFTAPTGKAFAGWKDAEDNDYEVGATVDGDVTLYAQWADAYAVTFTVGAGSGTAPSGFESVEGAKFNLPGQGDMVAPSGKVFDGWKAASTKYAAGAEYTMGNAAVEFVAQWKNAPETIFNWTFANTSNIETDNTDLSNATYGTLTTGTSVTGRLFGTNTISKNAAGYKLGNDDVAIEIQGTKDFADGDTVIITGQNGGTGNRCFTVAPSSATSAASSDTIQTNAIGSQTANSIYKVVITSTQAGEKMRVFRLTGKTMYIKSIKVIRPAAREIASTVITLSDLKVNNRSISSDSLATLVSAHSLTLKDEFAAAPEIKFNEHKVITYDDELLPATKVTDKVYTVTATTIDSKWQAQQTINSVAYTVIAPKVTAAKVYYYDGATKLGEEIVAINGSPVNAGDYDDKTLSSFVGWYNNADLAEEHKIANIAALVVTKDTTVYGKWNPEYATSINIEQWVLTNGAGKGATTKTSALISQLGTNNFASNLAWENGNIELDSLDDSKSARNNPYLGLKVKKGGKMLDFRLAAGKTVKVKFGNVGTTPNVAINGGEYAAMTISEGVYSYTAVADAYISIKMADDKAVVFKQIMIGDAPEFETVVLPYRVTYDADGGTFAKDGKSDIYTGTPLVIGDATPADDDHLFDGWYDGDTKINAASYVPTANVTLVAKYVMKPSPFSLTALTYTIGAGAAQNVGYVEGTYTYTVELPYKGGDYENITVAATLKEVSSSIVEGAVMTVTSLPGAATFTVSDGAEGTQLYTINFKKAAKDGVEIIGVVTTGGENKTVSGLYKGDASVNLDADKKIGSGKYIYVTLASGYTFEETDVLVVDVHKKADIDGGTKALEITTGVGNIDGDIWKSIALEDYTTGENIIPLTGIAANQTSIGLKRSSNQNTWVNGLKVYRPMNPVLKKVTVNGVEGTPVANVISIEVPASTTQTQLEAIAYDWVSNSDAWTAAHTPAAANAWEFGVANTVTLTDKDGDESVYTITVSKAEASHDATLSALSVEGYSLSPAFDPAELTYNVELAKGTVIGDLPAVSYTLNHAGATAVKTDAVALPGATTIVVTAEDGLEANKKTYTIHFTVSTKDKVVIFDGSTMDDFATSPGANGLSWATAGYSKQSKSVTVDTKEYTKAMQVSSTNNERYLEVTVPAKYNAQFYLIHRSNGSDARTVFVSKTRTSTIDNTIYSAAYTSSETEFANRLTPELAAGTYYINVNGGTTNFFEVSVYLDRVSEAPTISAQPAALAVCDAATNATALSVTASVEAGTLSYQWYKVVEEGDDVAVGTNSNEFVPTALGDYYVVVTNTEGSYKPSSTKSETATVSQKAATEITGTVNVKGDLGATTQKLSVTATGAGELTYAWFAYDIVNEETTGAKLSETNELGGLTITEETQYYQVTVTGDCGSVSEILTVSKWIAVEQADVTGSMTWDWNKTSNAAAWSGVANIQLTGADRTTDIIMANTSSAMPNNEHFRSDMLVTNGEYPARPNQDNGVFQGYAIKFHTTVPGVVAVTYRGTGNSEVVKLQINDWADETGISSGKDNMPTKKMFVPAGDVTIKEKDGKVLRIEKIVFNAEPDYTRSVTEGRYGTICLPNGGVMVGATVFEVAYYGQTSEKIFFDEVLNGEMEAGVPYIFQPKEGASQLAVFYTDNAGETAKSVNGLVGFIGSGEDDEMNVPVGAYILNNNQYRKVVTLGTAKIKGYRSYINLNAITPTEPALAPGRRRISMSVEGTNTATGVDEIQGDKVQCTKVMINGQLFILRGEKLYDATGRLVK